MLLRQTLLYLPAQTLVPLSQMIAAFLWTYWLGPEHMGTYALIWSVQELIYLVVFSWWSTYCLRYANGLIQDGKGLEFDSLEMAVQLTAALVQAILALLAVISIMPNAMSWTIILSTLSFTLTRNASTHFATRARAQLEALPYSINLGLGSVLGLVFGLIAVIYVDASPQALLCSYAAAQFLGLALSLPFSRVSFHAPKWRPDMLATAWRFGWPLMLSAALSWVGNQAIRFIVEFGVGRAAVGLMTVGWWMGMRAATFVGLLFMGAAFNVAVERFRTHGRDAAIDQLATNTALLLGILVPSVVGVWLVGDEIVRLLVAETYRETTMRILPLAMAAGAARVMREHGSDPSFLVFERPVFAPACASADAIGTAILGALGLWWGGVIGAAWGCLFASALAAALSFVLARGYLRYYIAPSHLVRIGTATAAMAVLLAWLPHGSSLLGLFIVILAGASIYALSLAMLYPQQTTGYARMALGGLSRLNVR